MAPAGWMIEKLGGAIVRTLPPQSAPAGPLTITWDATLDGRLDTIRTSLSLPIPVGTLTS